MYFLNIIHMCDIESFCRTIVSFKVVRTITFFCRIYHEQDTFVSRSKSVV